LAKPEHPRGRKAKDLRRASAGRRPYDRILIVCEGKKTEPGYLEDMRRTYRLSSADIKIVSNDNRTEPLQIVDGAIVKFKETRGYEQVYAVFDRDEHRTYADAIARAKAQDNKLRNDEGRLVRFQCVPSVPCFELWLLLHFENVENFAHRDDIIRRIAQHIPRYSKAMAGIFSMTSNRIDDAIARAQRLRGRYDLLPGIEPRTEIDQLVETLRILKR